MILNLHNLKIKILKVHNITNINKVKLFDIMKNNKEKKLYLQ